jgi:hypothetical protein
MKMDESGNENDRSIIFRVKVFYWAIALLFSVALAYLSGVDFRAADFRNQRAVAIVLGLVFGIFLVYVNIFHANYNFLDRIVSSLVYLLTSGV